MQRYYATKDDIRKLIASWLEQFKVFASEEVEEKFFYKLLANTDEDFVISPPYRQVEPLKAFLSKVRETIAYYPEGDFKPHAEETIIIGTKACDLRALKVHDAVFLEGDFKDPVYEAVRQAMYIVSSDCCDFSDECFCLGVGGKPYPEEGFDINLSPVGEDFIVEVASDKGEKLLEIGGVELKEVSEELVAKRDEARKALVEKLQKQVDELKLPKVEDVPRLLDEKYEHPLWAELSENCVECGSCTNVCPGCHCFLIFDAVTEEGYYERLRTWDSCQFAGFSKVAAGANPLENSAARLRNRIIKKFQFLPRNYGGILGCVGCGRCVAGCPAKIDIREVLRELGSREPVQANTSKD